MQLRLLTEGGVSSHEDPDDWGSIWGPTMFHITYRRNKIPIIKRGLTQALSAFKAPNEEGIYLVGRMNRDVFDDLTSFYMGGDFENFMVVEVNVNINDLLMDEDTLYDLEYSDNLKKYLPEEAVEEYLILVKEGGADLSDDTERFRINLINKYNIKATPKLLTPVYRKHLFTARMPLSKTPLQPICMFTYDPVSGERVHLWP